MPGAGYVGQPIFKVTVQNGSPFQGIPHQEWSYYFTEDNFDSLADASGISAIPPPFNGVRCAEKLFNYDNFLVDASGKKLEEATTDGGKGLVSPSAALSVAYLKETRSKATEKYDDTADDFFTWKVLDYNFYNTSDTNPKAKPFNKMNDSTNRGPKWAYAEKKKGDGSGTPNILTPFMSGLSGDPKKGVHWACETAESWPVLQPFELYFFNEGSEPDIPREEPPLKPTINGIFDAKKFNVDISKRAYLAITFGGNSSVDGKIDFLMLIVRGESPRMYKITGTGKASLVSVFQGSDGEKYFSADNKEINIKIEPVAFGMIISSSLFGDKKWLVNVTDSAGAPIFMGGKKIKLFSGNVKAGFAIRPVQYTTGVFTTEGQPVETAAGEDSKPLFTTAMKGGGSNAAARSTNGQEIHAVDADKVNGEGVMSYIDSIAKDHPGGHTDRLITFEPIALDVQESSNVKTTTWGLKVTMTPSDVYSEGFTIKNGRTPYLWQIRGELTPKPKGGGGAGGVDISCAVLSCDLTWSANSFTEFSHTGTLKILMRPNSGVEIPANYANRALYITIDAGWQNGVDNSGINRIFTGMSVGSSIDQTAETDILTLQLEDYMNALEGAKFVLSPYYDGMIAKLAVKDIVKQLGISDGDIAINEDSDPTDYGLPFNNPFEQPQFRFKMGSSLKSGVLKIAELDLKCVFFDEDGKFHYDSIPGGIFNNSDTTPVENFVTSPKDGSLMQVVWNTFSAGRHINDVFNIIQVNTVDKETGQLIHIGDAFEESIFSPGAEGYLGYRKHLIVSDPSIGSYPAAGRYLSTYRDRVRIPPYTYKFETYGRGGLRPLGIVTIDGSPARVMNISMHADAKENNWWMNVECEWFDSAI